MKILMVNKFLFPNGGSETYIFKIGDYLKSLGHEVEYFGMEHSGRIVSNSADCYVSNMDFHDNRFFRIINPFKLIYSREAKRKITRVLEEMKPDVVHLNNFNFQLTPSILYAIRNYQRKSKQKVHIIYTAHDYQLLCPNHMMFRYENKENCEKCLGGKFISCTKGKCIHGSLLKSLIGTVEGYLYHFLKTYRCLDAIICPSRFLADKMRTNPVFKNKIIVLHNFIDRVEPSLEEKEDYILYFGRYSEEKGINTLLEICKVLPSIQFVFAGIGPLESGMAGIPNIINVGFQTGEALEQLIRKARFSVYPSQWYENCPFSVMESQMYQTPVLGSDAGGIPELIEVGHTGELFKNADAKDLKNKIESLWNDRSKTAAYSKNCKDIKFDTVSGYCNKLLKIYSQ